MRFFVLLLLFFCFSCKGNPVEPSEKELYTSGKNLWKGSYFQQNSVEYIDLEKGTIKARVDGRWENFEMVELPDDFIRWSSERRLETLDRVRKNEMPSLTGPHSGMVASYGVKRNDSKLSINNAVKGMGFLPKPEKIKGLLALLENTKDSSDEYKLKVLESLYSNVDEYFTRKALVSLELYTTPEFETHTFLNEMVNPAVSVVFLDFPSFEVRAISRLLHPEDPQIEGFERDVVKYANLIHSYFHGDFPKDFITVIYYIVEVFDNTPGRSGQGRRVMPPLP